MLIPIPDVLSSDAALSLRDRLLADVWVDGNITSGPMAALAKRNRQLPESSIEGQQGQRQVQRALAASPLFLSAALPQSIIPPLFNRYGVGDSFGPHVDNGIRLEATTGRQIRTDLSATLFLSDPLDYDGGELVIEGNFGTAEYKLPAGHLLLYPSSSLHHVRPVTRGERVCSFFWIQSLVRDGLQRESLFELDQSIQALCRTSEPDDAIVLRLTNLYHNLIRQWAC